MTCCTKTSVLSIQLICVVDKTIQQVHHAHHVVRHVLLAEATYEQSPPVISFLLEVMTLIVS
jgi:hypothetical protein